MNIEIEQSKSGVNTLKINQYYIHSKYDPIKEANIFADKKYEAGKTYIIFGYGLGYIVDRLSQLRQLNEKIIVIDPYMEITNENLENIYFIDCNKVNKLTNYLNAILTDEDTGITEVICSPNYNKIDEQVYEDTFKKISGVLKAKIINYNTIQSLAWTWYENFVDNMRFIIRDMTISKLFDRFTCPAIIVAGGPSLTKQIPLLQSIKGKCIIISAGSTIRTLLKYDIQPDFIVNVDGGEKNLAHFEQLNDSKIPYLYGLQSTAGIREKFKGQCYYFSPFSEPLSEKFSRKFIPDVKKIEGGVSVATYSLAIASYITSGPIALIGQDLAYTDNSSHADGNIQQVKKEIEENHFYKKIEGYYGEDVYSDVTLISMKDNLEQVLQVFKGQERAYYNCTEGGAKIHHIEQLPFSTFIDRNIHTEAPIDLISTEEKLEVNDYKDFLLNSVKSIKARKLGIQQCILQLSNGQNHTAALKVELDKCNRLIEELNLQGIVNAIHLKLNKEFKVKAYSSQEMKNQDAIRKNDMMFRELLEMFERVERLFEQQLVKI